MHLKELARTFTTYQTIPVVQILSAQTAIELSGFENLDERLLHVALLLRITAYATDNIITDGHACPLLVLEEAHVLLDAGCRVAQQGEASPGAVARLLLSNLLAEIRTYGIRMVVADQSPCREGQDMIDLTGLKVAFRMVESDDREIIAFSTGMNGGEQARLRVGETLTYFDQLDVPEHIVTPNHRAEMGLRVHVGGNEIRIRMTYWQTNSALLVPFPECALIEAWDPQQAAHSEELARQAFVAAGLTPPESVSPRQPFKRPWLASSPAPLPPINERVKPWNWCP